MYLSECHLHIFLIPYSSFCGACFDFLFSVFFLFNNYLQCISSKLPANCSFIGHQNTHSFLFFFAIWLCFMLACRKMSDFSFQALLRDHINEQGRTVCDVNFRRSKFVYVFVYFKMLRKNKKKENHCMCWSR